MMNERVDIEMLLPHKAPMLMVSAVVTKGDSDIHCQAHIDEANPFVHDDIFPGFACLELVAQACGIFLGMKGPDSDHPVPGALTSGVIASVRDMSVGSQQIHSGAVLDVVAEFLGGSQQAAMFSGKVRLENNEIFSVKVTVAASDEETV